MSAPSGTKWGDVVSVSGGNFKKGQIGIYVSGSGNETTAYVSVQVWFRTIYSCYDGSNNIYFNIGENVTEATTRVGSIDISHKYDQNVDEWDPRNQTKIYSKTYTYTRNASARTINIRAKFNGIDMLSGQTMSAKNSVTIEALPRYTVSYYANGGSGAPDSQTKIHGQDLTLRNTKPTKNGYTFKGWTNDPNSTEVIWTAGGKYTINASRKLYAVWQAKTYTISYNANGGSGAPKSQTKTHGKDLTLSSTKPTRTNYNFEGWTNDPNSTEIIWTAGGKYTIDASRKLYAVWSLAYAKPRITNFSVRRVNQNGQNDDQGTICKVIFNWATDKANPTITVSYRQTTSSGWNNINLTASGTSGSVSQNLSPAFSIDNSYEIKVTVEDDAGSSYATRTLPSAKFLIDFKAGGDGIAIGKAAENAGFDVYMDTKFEKSVTTLGDFRVTGKTTLDGNLTGKYITGTWLQTTAATDLNSTPPKVAVLDNSGWIYSRTPSDLKSDMGLSKIFISQTISPKDWNMPANSSRGGEIKGTFKGYEGYMPILTSCYCINSLYVAIINAWLSGSYSSSSNGYTWHIDARNFASSNITADFSIKILYIKSNLFG